MFEAKPTLTDAYKKKCTVFPLIIASGADLFLKLQGVAPIGRVALKRGRHFFKLKRVLQIKFQNFVIVFSQITQINYHFRSTVVHISEIVLVVISFFHFFV